MAVFISKKALAKIPDQFTSTYIPVGREVLRSNFLKANLFFGNLVTQGQGAKELLNGDIGDEVRNLQILLNVVRKVQTGNQPNIVIDGVFGNSTENELEAAQQELGLSQSGVLDSQTLLAIDTLLVESGAIFNTTTGVVYHEGIGVDPARQEYEVTIISSNGDIEVKAKPLPDAGNVNFSDLEDAAISRRAFPNEDLTKLFIADDRYSNEVVSRNGYFVESGLVPQRPSGLPPDARPRTIQEGETLISIIHEEYLQNAYPIYTIPGDNTSAVLHEFPARSLTQDDKDYRIRFYANLIYYLNTDPGITYAITRNSTASSAVDYTDVHLDEINIYDNQTLGLNYKNFLDRIEQLDPNYEWNLYASNYTVLASGQSYTFDAPFTLEVGKDLYLPSREFVESLFLHLNFRPKEGEMYEKKTDAEGNDYFDWIPQSGFDTFLDNVRNAISDTVEEALTVDLYTEAYTFFKNIYSWIIDTLNDYWPRSMGFQANLDAEVAALFGIGVGSGAYVWRKVTPKDEITIQTIMNSEVRGTVGGGIGFDIGGKKKGKGGNVGSKKASKKGVAAYAGVNAGVGVTIYQEHEFPINKENTALLALLLPAINASSTVASGLNKILNYLEVINIDPMDYITKLVVEIKTEGRAFAQLNFGLNITNASDYGQNEQRTYTVDQKNQDALSVNGVAKLFKKLDFYYGGGAEISAGFAWETNWTYKNLPELYKYDGRMASKVTSQIELFYGASVALDATVSDFVQRLVFGAIGGVPILPTFKFDKGISVLAGLELERDAIPENHEFADYDLSLANLGDPNNNISKFLGAKLYSGDFEVPVTPASEVIVNINIDTLKQIIDGQSGNTEILTFTNLIAVFDKLVFHKRFSADLETFMSNQNNKVLDRVRFAADSYRNQTYENDDSTETRSFKEYVQFLGDTKKGFSFASSVDIYTEFSLASTIHAIHYLMLRLRFLASRQKFVDANQLSNYQDKEKLINEAYQEFLKSASTNLIENDFDFLLNNGTWGIQTILDVGGSGENDLVAYNEILGELFRFLDEGELKGLLQAAQREDLITQSQKKLLDLLELFTSTFRLLVKQSNPTIKLNTSLSVNAAINLKGAFGPKVSLAAFFDVGFFDEILVLQDGELVLEGATTDTPLYNIIQTIAKLFSDDSNTPDFESGNEVGGIVAQTLLNETI
jgi:peptidoglycan hydrolase-like protein with peptidoglycan-binding domain